MRSVCSRTSLNTGDSFDGNHNNFFGVSDPAPGEPKVAAIHVRIKGHDHHLRAAEGQLCHFPIIEVLDAWYGVVGSTEVRGGGEVVNLLCQNIAQHGGIVLDGNLNDLFGFDPAPGVRRVAAIHARINDQEFHLHAVEGQLFHFPNVEVVHAWYGVEYTNRVVDGGQVTKRLQQNVAQHGRLVLDGKFNNFFGVTDPAPGEPKVAAIHVRVSEGGGFHLHAVNGTRFEFPERVV